MKTPILIEHARRIDRALALLAERLEEGEAPSLEALAEAAAMSKYHFHRVFRLMTGETVNEATRRLRLARGVATARSATVTDGAGEAAYATSQAFARAMRACTGLSVTEAVQRADLDRLLAPPRGGAPLAVELVSLAPIRVAAIRNRGDYSDLDQAFGRLFELVRGPEFVTGIYGLYHSDSASVAPEDCLFDAAVSLADGAAVPAEAEDKVLGGGHFLKLRHLGNYDAIAEALDALTLHALVDERLRLKDSPPLAHYLDDPEEVAEAELRADLFLAVATTG